MPWYVYLALKQLFATRGRLFFTAMSALSVALGVAVMVIVLSVMGGFGEKISEMMVNTEGDVQVLAQTVIEDPAAVDAVVRAVPGVVATSGFAQGVAMVMHGEKPSFPFVQGLDLDTIEKVAPVGGYVRVGSLNDLDDDSVILSSQLADSIAAGIGSRVEVYSPAIIEHAIRGDVAILPRELTVVGIFQIGHQQLDKSTVILTLRTMQDLYALGSGVHGFDVRIADRRDVDAETKAINAALSRAQGHGLPHIEGLWARSYKMAFGDFLWAVQMEKSMMTFILLIVVLVAAFLTMGLLIVQVLKKTREIGLLGALGATRAQVAACFCLQGIFIGLIGTGLGIGFGFLALHFRDAAVQWLTRATGGGADAVANIYQFSSIPAHTDGSDLAIIVIAALVLSTLAGAVPATMAARLRPADALRNE